MNKKTVLEHTLCLYLNEKGLVKIILERSSVSKYISNTFIIDVNYDLLNYSSISLCKKYLVFVFDDKSIKIWDIRTERVIRTIPPDEEYKFEIIKVVCRENIVVISSWHRIKIYNIQTGEYFLVRHDHIVSLSISPCLTMIVCGCSFSSTIRIFNVMGEYIRTLAGHTEDVSCAEFSPCGKFLVSGSDDKTIRLWNVENGECIWTSNNQNRWVRRISYSPCGGYIASWSDDYSDTVKIWDTTTRECIWSVSNGGHVCVIDFSPCGNFVLYSLVPVYGNMMKIYNVTTGNCTDTLAGQDTVGRIHISYGFDNEIFALKNNKVDVWTKINILDIK